jgi:hypothetical protein
MPLNWNIDRTIVPHAVKLEGVLDEHVALDELEPYVREDKPLDLRGVRRVNSAGIYRWIAFAKRVGDRLKLRACSRVFVEHLSLLPEFRCSAKIESVVLPYFCGKCERDTEIIEEIDAIRLQLATGKLPARTCAVCGNGLDFDEDPATYFRFLSRG